MKIVAILGSPHKNGNGATALKAILNGAKTNGHEIQLFELASLNIHNCLGCRKCIENDGICVLKDDYTEIYESIKTGDTVIIESPIYINQVNGLTKTFLDRCYPLTDVHHKPRFGKRDLILLCTYAVPIPFIFSNYIRSTAKSLKAMGFVCTKRIIINGCTTIDKAANDAKLLKKLKLFGKGLKRPR